MGGALVDDDLQSLIRELGPSIASDPRARPTIRVGTIGHRAIPTVARDAITATIGDILGIVRGAAEEILRYPSPRAQYTGDLDLVVVSPLAEGADRQIASTAQKHGYRLGAILPFAIADYERTFDLGDAGAAVAEFRSLLETAVLPRGYGVLVLDGEHLHERRDIAFINCAKVVTRWSDILIAILSKDRQESQSWFSVREAIDAGVPIVEIDPADPASFSLWLNGAPIDASQSCTELQRLVQSLLSPSGSGEKGLSPKMGERHSGGLLTYKSERISYDASVKCDFEYCGPFRARTIAPAIMRGCAGLSRLFESFNRPFQARPVGEAGLKAPQVSLGDLPFNRSTMAPIVELFLRYLRADAIANAYAELYRGAQIVVVFLGFATVILASPNVGNSLWRFILAAAEFVCLFTALVIVATAHRQAWLDRWLNYRLLAEVFRYARYLLLTGQPSPLVDLRGSYVGDDTERAWTRDHIQQVLRAHPLAVPGRGVEVDDSAMSRIRNYLILRCVDDQIAYHERTAPTRQKFSDWLRRISVGASYLTLIAVFGKVVLAGAIHVGDSIPGRWSDLLQAVAIVFPAITGALLALRAYGEHEVVAKRSTAMIGSLKNERRAVARSRDILNLSEGMLRVSHLLLREVDGWLELFADKHLE